MSNSPLDFAIVANNTLPITGTVYKMDGKTKISLTNCTVKWQVLKKKGSPAVITKEGDDISISDQGTNKGEFVININAVDTALLLPGWYIHEAVVTDAEGKPITLTNNDAHLSHGRLFVRGAYTQ